MAGRSPDQSTYTLLAGSVTPFRCMTMSEWPILKLTLDGGVWPTFDEWSKSFTGCFIPGESVCCIHWVGSWMGRIASVVWMYRRLTGPPVRNWTTISRTSNLYCTYYTRLSSTRVWVAFPTYAVASIFWKVQIFCTDPLLPFEDFTSVLVYPGYYWTSNRF